MESSSGSREIATGRRRRHVKCEACERLIVGRMAHIGWAAFCEPCLLTATIEPGVGAAMSSCGPVI